MSMREIVNINYLFGRVESESWTFVLTSINLKIHYVNNGSTLKYMQGVGLSHIVFKIK